MKAPFVLGLALVAGLVGTARSADLSVQPLAPVAATTWTGFYIGANAGVATQWSTVQDLNSWSTEDLLNISSKVMGATAGGQAGYNIQDGSFVYGIEADWNWTGTKSDRTLTDTCACGDPVVVQIHTEMNWVATVRGRAGLTMGTTLAYVTGGLAVAEFDNHWGAGFANPAAGCGGAAVCGPANNNNFVSHNAQLGWAAGFGIEHMFAGYPHLTFRVEAMWLNFANNNVANAGPSSVSGLPGPFTSQFQNQAALARAGLNYKF
jgi:outer membrane immunogenic protein